jgi:hypothetical protein
VIGLGVAFKLPQERFSQSTKVSPSFSCCGGSMCISKVVYLADPSATPSAEVKKSHAVSRGGRPKLSGSQSAGFEYFE